MTLCRSAPGRHVPVCGGLSGEVRCGHEYLVSTWVASVTRLIDSNSNTSACAPHSSWLVFASHIREFQPSSGRAAPFQPERQPSHNRTWDDVTRHTERLTAYADHGRSLICMSPRIPPIRCHSSPSSAGRSWQVGVEPFSAEDVNRTHVNETTQAGQVSRNAFYHYSPRWPSPAPSWSMRSFTFTQLVEQQTALTLKRGDLHVRGLRRPGQTAFESRHRRS